MDGEDDEDYRWQRESLMHSNSDCGVIEYILIGDMLRESVYRKPGDDVVWLGDVPYLPRKKSDGTWENVCGI